ncbi:MAG: response regulator [Candidatus Niyogibacteria bacterium]|nr:response regulator [Candidatus Niyogibacteria bacterium]
MTELSKKVLIIEDEEDVARAYEIKLKKSGIETALAADGEDGLAKILAEKPGVVLLDLMLPIHDGFWVLEQLKAKGISGVKVIVLSNLGQEKDRERALALGAAEYLVKANVSIKEVVDKVFGYLGVSAPPRV